MSDKGGKNIFGEVLGLWEKYEESLFRHRFSGGIVKRLKRGCKKS